MAVELLLYIEYCNHLFGMHCVSGFYLIPYITIFVVPYFSYRFQIYFCNLSLIGIFFTRHSVTFSNSLSQYTLFVSPYYRMPNICLLKHLLVQKNFLELHIFSLSLCLSIVCLYSQMRLCYNRNVPYF
jgi:hypothetical protein